jgi:hypothetical protein
MHRSGSQPNVGQLRSNVRSVESKGVRPYEAPADGWLPMRRDPLRDHPGTTDGLYLSLRRLPADDKLALSRWPVCSPRGPSVSFEASRKRSNALPIAGAKQSGGSVRNAVRGSTLRGPARRCATYVAEPWMTPLGCAPRCTSGCATNSLGSRYQNATRFSRRNPQIWCGSFFRPGERRPLHNPARSR